MKALSLLSLILMVSCGKFTHKIVGVPEKVKVDVPSEFKVGPDFEKAAKFCDDRYGKDTNEAEDCFQDYRNYTKLNIGINIDALSGFCDDNYSEQNDKEKCLQELIDLLKQLNSLT